MNAYTDTITTGAVVIVAAVTSFVQEFRAEKGARSSEKLAAPIALVVPTAEK